MTFRRNMLSPSSGSENEASKKPERNRVTEQVRIVGILTEISVSPPQSESAALLFEIIRLA
jgi:hypothetical protein